MAKARFAPQLQERPMSRHWEKAGSGRRDIVNQDKTRLNVMERIHPSWHFAPALPLAGGTFVRITRSAVVGSQLLGGLARTVGWEEETLNGYNRVSKLRAEAWGERQNPEDGVGGE